MAYRPLPEENTAVEQWPPRSPHEAFLSSPSRRRKLQTDGESSEISVPPSKRRRVEEPSDDNDDDEETLQLQLKEIQAKLKLKKLQKSKQSSTNEIRSQPLPKDDVVDVQVPLSPRRKEQPPQQPESPRRVLLGIDKGLRAADVSLKRPAPPKRELARADSTRKDAPQPKSFSERLAEVRSTDADREAKRERIKKIRSRGFDVTGLEQSSSNNLPPSRSVLKSSEASRSRLDDSDSNVDPISGFALSKQVTSPSALEKAMQGKAVYSLPKLLKQVVSPDYEPPDDDDFVVVAIVASKSDPHNHTSGPQIASSGDPDDPKNNRSKFMVLHLTDLEWELDMFLFDSGFEKYWKMTVGTVVAILNPGIMPPKTHMKHSGKFSLKLSSSEDQILEIGSSKDLGWCESVKKDGQKCGQWVDRRKTEFCEFHVNLQVEKARAGRMELNGMPGLSSWLQGKANRRRGGGSGGGGGGASSRGGSNAPRHKNDRLRRGGEYYDRTAGERAFVGMSRGATIASLLDREDYAQTGLSQKESHRKRMDERQKERDLARQLADQGSGMGAEYSRMRNTEGSATDPSKPPSQSQSQRDASDAMSLGLVRSSAADVHLSPVKRRSQQQLDNAVGWSHAYRRGLPPSPLKKALKTSTNPPQHSPTKSTRFVLEKKGIRRPGRESASKEDLPGEDDDDGLDIV